MLKRMSGREKALLVVLCLALVWVVWYLGFNDDRRSGDGGDASEAVATPWGDPPVVRMDMLASMSDIYDSQGRDLFKYSKPPRSQEEIDAENERKAKIEEARAAAQERARAVRTAQRDRKPKPPAGPRLPRATFSYIGHLGPKDDRIAVFSEGEEIFLARIGEVVKEDFRLMEIDYQSIVLGYTDPKFADQTQRLEQKSK